MKKVLKKSLSLFLALCVTVSAVRTESFSAFAEEAPQEDEAYPVSEAPEEPDQPDVTEEPEITDEPEEDPEITDEPEEDPEITDEPEEEPEITDEPEEEPEITDEPGEEPENTDEPEEEPEDTDEPEEEPEESDDPEEDDSSFTSAAVLKEDMVISDDLYLSSNLDLNGYTLTVAGDMYCTKSKININGGTLSVGGSLYLANHTEDASGKITLSQDGITALTMESDSDKVIVGGDLVSYCFYSHKLYGGTITVNGDFTDYNGSFAASVGGKPTNVTLVFNGKKLTSLSNSVFFRNFEAGGAFTASGAVAFDYLKKGSSLTITPDGLSITGMHMNGSTVTINGDCCFTGEGSGHDIDLGGGTLNINGTLRQTGAHLYINGGTLNVKGSYIAADETVSGGKPSYSMNLYAGLYMTAAGDKFNVDGDWVSNTFEDFVLRAGTITVNGSFTDHGSFTESVDDKPNAVSMIFNGKKLTSGSGCAYFGYFEAGGPVTASGTFAFGSIPKGSELTIVSDGLHLAGLRVNGGKVVINGDCGIAGSGGNEIDLEGGTLIINGTLRHSGGTLSINGGTLNVRDDYIAAAETGGSYIQNTNAAVYMTDNNDFFSVGGDWVTYVSDSSEISAGAVAVDGNITDYSGVFCPDSGVKMVFGGKKLAAVDCDMYFRSFEAGRSFTASGAVAFGDLKKGNDLSIVSNGLVISDTRMNGNTVTISGDCGISGGEVDLEGGTLNINGTLRNTGASLKTSGGTLSIKGDYICADETEGSDGKPVYSQVTGAELCMDTAKDKLSIGGRWVSYTSEKNKLYEGTVTVNGGIIDYNGSFPKSVNGRSVNSTFIFDGDGAVSCLNGTMYFSAAKFNSTPELSGKISFGRLLGDAEIFAEDLSLGGIDLNGNELIINGDIEILDKITVSGALTVFGSVKGVSGDLVMDRGTLHITGDYYSIKEIVSSDGSVRYEPTASGIQMTNNDDSVMIDGDFTSYVSGGHRLKDGVLVIGGNIKDHGSLKDSFEGTKEESKRTNNAIIMLEGEGNKKITALGGSTIRFTNLMSGVTGKLVCGGSIDFGNMLSDMLILPADGGLELAGMWLNGKSAYINGDITLGGDLHIGGGMLTISGDINAVNGNICVEKGSVLAGGDYICVKETSSDGKVSYTYRNSNITMNDEEDRFTIDGDFISYSWGGHKLNDGILTIGGDITDWGSFRSYYDGNKSYKNTVVMSGTGNKRITVRDGNTAHFTNLAVSNNGAIVIEGKVDLGNLLTDINLVSANTGIIAGMLVNGHKAVIDGTVTVSGNIKLDGGKLTVNGNLGQTDGTITADGAVEIIGGFFQENGVLSFENGSVYISGDYNVGTAEKSVSSYFRMTNDNDTLIVEGDFITNSKSTHNIPRGNITFNGSVYDYSSDLQYTSGSAVRIKLGGSGNRVISAEKGSTVYLGDLSMTGTSGKLVFNGSFRINKLLSDIELNTELLTIKSLDCNGYKMTINGDCLFDQNDVNINGGSLIVNGSLNQTSGVLSLGGGTLRVENDYVVAAMNSERAASTRKNGSLSMRDDNDRAYIGGSFVTDSNNTHTLTAGVLTICGELIDLSSSFVASGTHKTVLAGDKKQSVTFSDRSTFNILQLTRPKENYMFTREAWKTLLQVFSVEFTGAVITVNGEQIKNGDYVAAQSKITITPTHTDNCSAITYINGEKVSGNSFILDRNVVIDVVCVGTIPLPIITKAVPGSKKVTLEWRDVPNAVNYRVFTYTDGTFSKIADTGLTSYTVQDLTNGVKYGFLVLAYNGMIWSKYTVDDVVFATPEAPIIPLPGLKAAAGDMTVTLSWNAVSKAEKYRIFNYSNGSFSRIADTASTSYVIKNLTNGIKYGFIVLAYSEEEWSKYTVDDVVYAIPEAAAAALPKLTATAGNASVSLKWSEVSDAEKYRVFSYINGIYTPLAETTATSFTANDLANGVKYGFLVLAYNGRAWSKYSVSDVVYATPKDMVPLPELKVTPGNASAALKWSAVAGAKKYRVFTYVNGIFNKLADTTNTSYTAKSLTNGVKYGFLVLAYNGSVWSKYTVSDVVYATPKVIIPLPALKVTAGNASASLKWNAVSGAVKYRVFTYVNGKFTKLADTTAVSYTAKKLANDFKYGFLVLAYNGSVWSSYSVSDVVYATPKLVLALPALSVTPGNASASLKWNAVPGATKYRVFTYINKKFSKLAETTATSYTAKKLSNGVKYGFLVLAGDGGTWSKYSLSDVVYATPNNFVALPKLKAAAGNAQVMLSWDAVSGAKKYRIFTYINGTYAKLAETTGTKYLVNNLINDVKYGFLVLAYNGANWSKYSSSNVVYAAPKASGLLLPMILKVSAGSKQVALTWSSINGATKYRVFTYINGKYTKLADTKSTGYTAKGLAAGVRYGFLVLAYNGKTWSSYSVNDNVYATPVN